MTDDEKKEYTKAIVQQTKKYCHIDYDDDEDIIEIMMETVFEKLDELIPGFNKFDMTSRQKLLVMTIVKDLYDNREAYSGNANTLSNAASSMLLNEKYGGGRL